MATKKILAPCGRPFRVGVEVFLNNGAYAQPVIGRVVGLDPDMNADLGGTVWVKVSHETDPRLPDHPDVTIDRMPADPRFLRVRHCGACLTRGAVCQ